MNSFQKTVIITCVVLLIVALGILAGLLHLASQNATYPPNINLCPDYWDVSFNSVDGVKTCINNSAVNHCKMIGQSLNQAIVDNQVLYCLVRFKTH